MPAVSVLKLDHALWRNADAQSIDISDFLWARNLVRSESSVWYTSSTQYHLNIKV